MPASFSFDQARYQVRTEWGVEGMRRLAPTDVTVVVDVLRFSSTVTARLAAGEGVPLDESAHAVSLNGAAVADAASSEVVLLGCLRNASAVAARISELQNSRGGRVSVAVIAAGERDGREGPVRFAVEDQLGAGAVIAALAARGIDHSSPDAAVAAEAFRSLRRATTHLLTACGSGQELIARGLVDDIRAAAEQDVDTVVPELRAGAFVDGAASAG